MTDDARNIALGVGAEFDAIRQLLARWGPRAHGIGDDAAVIHPRRGDATVVSVDASIEGKHFEASWLTPAEIGYRAAVAALSDLAAMAARPTGMLIALAVPPQWRSRLGQLADGIGDAAQTYGAPILGGNMSGAGELSITTTVVGEVFAPLVRSGARIGDRVYVTGTFGGAGAALRSFQERGFAESHREKFVRPVARIAEAQWLASAGATAAVDVSDGLVADARHLAAASGVSIEIDAARIPCAHGVSVGDALRSGEEYELAATTSHDFDVQEFVRRFGIPLTSIGRVTAAGSRSVHVIGASDSDAVIAAASGHDHFSV